eukprot:CAMPEP_0197637870 /NCGR_PEP_ID=MMETSP1338-20131121/12969_1 /TAXON_ID=43686 ORGANISM="Pelagodinium beii, Strain RCC1491" /NCGR_SAMPLE_ID=MMETSP1338 /ASSEMBLY_ACC=CAM_ASM_000754 /LENGTH=35 /DNA_ID= /DNA_START= /DNA_END= /DNA_ORIENTATION=
MTGVFMGRNTAKELLHDVSTVQMTEADTSIADISS